MKSLTGKAKRKFFKDHSWFILIFPEYILNILALRWINNYICVDIIHWDNGYDFFVKHPFRDTVYSSEFCSEDRIKKYDDVVRLALISACKILNRVVL